MRTLDGAVLLVAGLLATGSAADPFPLTAAEQFTKAEKVLMAKIIHLAGWEHPPDRRRDRPYRYQVLWTRDAELFKGPPQHDRGFDLVMLPYKETHHERKTWTPVEIFDHPLTPRDLPEDHTLLLFLDRDRWGSWRVMDGKAGLVRYHGRTQLEELRKWAKTPPAVTLPDPGKKLRARRGPPRN